MVPDPSRLIVASPISLPLLLLTGLELAAASLTTHAAARLDNRPVLLLVAYLFAQRSRRRAAVKFTDVDLLASVAPRRPGCSLADRMGIFASNSASLRSRVMDGSVPDLRVS